MNQKFVPKLSEDVLEFLQLLNEHKVEYMIVGGWAVALHARPRYTKDLDIFVNRTEANAKCLMKVIVAFGFGDVGINELDFLREEYVIQLGYEPNRIDLLTTISPLEFTDTYNRRVIREIEGIKVSLIGAADLIKAKETAGRQQDLADAEQLRRMSKINCASPE